MSQIKVGVIGTGWGQLQIEAFRRVRSTRVTALCDIDLAKCEQLARQYQIERTFKDYQELISGDVDWISIAAPPGAHAEMILAAIDSGKHILAEKPLALEVETSRDLARQAVAKGLVHAVDLQMRYLPAIAYAKELIDEGLLGELFRADVTTIMERPWGEHGNWAIEESAGGGILAELGTYFIDLLCWWFGDIKSVLAGRRTNYPTVRIPGKKEKGNGKSLRQSVSAEDSFWSVLRFARGGEALVNFVSGSRHDAGWTVNMYGQTGSMLIKSGQLWSMRDGDREMGLVPIPKRLELGKNPDDPLMWAMSKLIDSVASKIQGSLPAQAYPDFADSLKAERVVHAIKRASEENKWLELT